MTTSRPLSTASITSTTAIAAAIVLALAAFADAIGPAVNPSMVVKKTAIRPPLGAKPATSLGQAPLAVFTANGETDEDSFWIERIDIDGDGDVEESHLLWDDEDNVLYAFSSGPFACKDGQAATYDLLVAARGKNSSGFWVANLDPGECGVKTGGPWGCTFDASRNPDSCGPAKIDDKNDSLIVTAEKSSPGRKS